jgi:chromosome partitioning protein
MVTSFSMKRAKTIAVFNMKGGVGKSTTTYNLAVGLCRYHQQKVLLVDIDPQGNASVSLGVQIWELEQQIKDVLLDAVSVEDVVIRDKSGVDVLPSNIFLAESEIPISGKPGRELLLRKAIAPVLEHYDFILIDCPPNIGVFSINALMASQGVIVPVDMSYLGLMGISAVERALMLVREQLDHPVTLTGVLATRFDSRNNLSKSVLDKLISHFGQSMFKTVIPEAVRLREAPSHAQAVFDYDPKGAGSDAYKALVDELMLR